MKIPFTKMHGLGNDFVVLDLTERKVKLSPEQICGLADRNFGIGFDQLLQIETASSAEVDFHYRIFNTDGSEVEHCGNGARCFATYIREKNLSDRNPIRVKTMNRTLSLKINKNGNVSVDMGIPEFNPRNIPFRAETEKILYRREVEIEGVTRELEFIPLSIGNPHAVIFVEDLANTAVKVIGEALGAHSDFPNGVNVGFAEIHSGNEVGLRVFERGAGETLACGTGACAAVIAGRLLHRLDTKVKVILTGGELEIEWEKGMSVLMTGPTKIVYEGTIEL
ncbi:MAG: diaminopimelate epimerase [Gammaproteobacteria bacterium]|nr:diaminopimelate epimerase [Gammaproteobacteria bacterium]